MVLHCRQWRWANADRVRSRRRCGWRSKTCHATPHTPFYARLNQILDQNDFDGFVEGRCERLYADEGRSHAVDLDTARSSGVTVQDADDGDAETSIETLNTAAEQIEAVLPEGGGLQEVVADNGYHSNQTFVDLEGVAVRSYISEPDRGRRNWKRKPEARAAVYRNPRRIRGARGLRLLRLRGERLERPFAQLYETGGCAAGISAGARTF